MSDPIPTPQPVPAKHWTESRTLKGVLIMAGGGVLGILGLDVTPADLDVEKIVAGALLLIGGIMGVTGRFRAQGGIKLKLPDFLDKAGLIIFAVVAPLAFTGCVPWASTVGVTSATPYGTVSVSWNVGGALATPDKQIATTEKPSTPDKQIARPAP
jgi:hypothetical protein